MASRCKNPSAALLVTVAGLLLVRTAAADDIDVPLCQAPSAGNVRVVTGAPYTALGTSETVTTLPDGNRVVRQNHIRLWRDSGGRTRSEISLSSIAGTPPVELHTTVTVIDDPAARQRYMLRPGENVAVTVPILPCRSEASLEPDLTVGPPRPVNLPLQVSSPVALGERKVNGETVAGRRIEATLPAGAAGNPQPIRMSAEQWYGKDLQVVIEATYEDPRTGETRYRLSDIARGEPDAHLFQVPDNYVKQPARH